MRIIIYRYKVNDGIERHKGEEEDCGAEPNATILNLRLCVVRRVSNTYQAKNSGSNSVFGE